MVQPGDQREDMRGDLVPAGETVVPICMCLHNLLAGRDRHSGDQMNLRVLCETDLTVAVWSH